MTPRSAALFYLRDFGPRRKAIYFNRSELGQLLDLYSRKVAAGEWRDYAIDHRDGFALFSVFRRTQESPAFTFVKRNDAARNAGEFAVFRGRQTVHAGTSLGEVLAAFQKRPSLVPSAG